ncbi:ferredoxin [Streptomyces sp. SYP-A7185]|uniref:ferredoxin n=1 Tax=Streptomyces sp. SYP-A7185 TaxID=3040076 RepID=UPI0038F74752
MNDPRAESRPVSVNAEEKQMDVRVDRDRCAGSGLCLAQVPAVFDQSDEDGKVLLTTPTPGPRLTAAVRLAAARCPSGAITLHEHEHEQDHDHDTAGR